MKFWLVKGLDFSGCYYEGDWPEPIASVFSDKPSAEAFVKLLDKESWNRNVTIEEHSF